MPTLDIILPHAFVSFGDANKYTKLKVLLKLKALERDRRVEDRQVGRDLGAHQIKWSQHCWCLLSCCVLTVRNA